MLGVRACVCAARRVRELLVVIKIDLRIVCAAQVKDQQSGTVYAFFHPRDYRQQQFLSFGTLDTTSGALEVLNKWTDPTLLFVINSLCAVDSESAQFYAGTHQTLWLLVPKLWSDLYALHTV